LTEHLLEQTAIDCTSWVAAGLLSPHKAGPFGVARTALYCYDAHPAVITGIQQIVRNSAKKHRDIIIVVIVIVV